MKKQIRLVAVLATASATLLLFQNCGTAFTAATSLASSSAGSGGNGSGSTGTTTTGNLAIQLSWAAPTSGQPSGYYIQQSTDGINYNQIQQVSASTLTTSVTSLGNAKYYFKVLSYNAYGTTSSAVLTADLTSAK